MAMRNFQFSIFNFQSQRGFALLVSLVFMSVMLAFGLALSTLAYKQQQLASSVVGSQHAFYAADAALECALYADQQFNVFAYTSNRSAAAPLITCDNASAFYPPDYPTGVLSHTNDQWVLTERLSFDSNTRCADVTVYKPAQSGTTYLFSQGYDVPCSTVADPGNARFTVRGVQTHYNSFAPVACTTETFAYTVTGGKRTWTVPAGVSSLRITARGAAGGFKDRAYIGGGKGAEVTGTLAVTPGEQLVIYVGGSDGFNGGGSYFNFTAGGGASDVRQGGEALANRVIVAGGGGGPGRENVAGGESGYIGQAGDSNAVGCGEPGGAGGTQEAGGQGGAGSCTSFGPAGTAGSLGQGGEGGFFSGGGGGGYYGGGGGTAVMRGGIKYAGGGGGSSWCDPAVTSGCTFTTTSTGGNGEVIVSACP